MSETIEREVLQHEAPMHRATISLKYSAWSTDPDYFQERAPRTYAMIHDGIEGGYFEETGETLVVASAPYGRKSPIDRMQVTFMPDQHHLSVSVEIEIGAFWLHEDSRDFGYEDDAYTMESIMGWIDSVEADALDGA